MNQSKLRQIVEFCIIGSIAGVIYQLVSEGIVNYKAFLMGSSLGLAFAIIELYFFSRYRKHFSKFPFLITIFAKALIYLLIINVFSGLIGLLVGLSEGKILSEFYESMLSKDQLILSIYTLVTYVSLSFLVQINLLLGEGVLLKFLLGKYRKPIVEDRIFMFLDINSSTTIAEKLGHEKYYALLNDFFHEISEPVRTTNAEIYQYVGDEVVFTWKTKEGVHKANCLNIFFQIRQKVFDNRSYYQDKYGVIPNFKAGVHYGEVISAQIGDIKREIVYNGDVLNTSARIQEQCNVFERELLISGILLKQLNISNEYQTEKIDTLQLRGKERAIELYSLVEA